jgi:hypothetical protein
MAFGDYKDLTDVALAFQIRVQVKEFIQPVPRPVDDRLNQELTFSLQNFNVRVSEAAVCEALIFPILKEAWKPYSDSLLLWSHAPLGLHEPLVGVPDYYFSRRSPLGMVRDAPYVLVVQAKKDDFETGWGHCLAAMLAAQQLNGQPPRTIYGCVTNGFAWEFGRLHDQEFTQELHRFSLDDLPTLLAVWNYVFAQAKEQALAPAA